MSAIDEFNSRRIEEIHSVKEVGTVAPEFGATAKSAPKKVKSKVVKMMLSTITGVSVLTTSLLVGTSPADEQTTEPETEYVYDIEDSADSDSEAVLETDETEDLTDTRE